MSEKRLRTNIISGKRILSLMLALCFSCLQSSAVFDYNEVDNSHVIDGKLFVGDISTGALSFSGEINADAFVGDGSGLTNLPASTVNGWKELASSIELQDLSHRVAVGQNTISGTAKLLVNGDLGLANLNNSSSSTRLFTDENSSDSIIDKYLGSSQRNNISYRNSSTEKALVANSTNGIDYNIAAAGATNNFTWKAANLDLMQLNSADGVLVIGSPASQGSEKLSVENNIKATSFIGDGSGITNVPMPAPPSNNFTCISRENSPGNVNRCNHEERCVSVFRKDAPYDFVTCSTNPVCPDAANCEYFVRRCCKIT